MKKSISEIKGASLSANQMKNLKGGRTQYCGSGKCGSGTCKYASGYINCMCQNPDGGIGSECTN